MNRRTFMGVFAPLALAGVAVAQEAAKKGATPRISGRIRNVDTKGMIIEVGPSKGGNVIRKVIYDANTQFITDDKPSSVADAKQGVRMVATGEWDGVNLKAKRVAFFSNR